MWKGDRDVSHSVDFELSRRSMLKLAAGGATAAALATVPSAHRAGAAPARQGTPGGSITIASGRTPLTYNPIDPIGGFERTVWQLTSSRLINKDVAGNIIPDLAETWEIAADGKSVTFNLVKTATWTDGTPVTAKDVVVTYTFAADERTGGRGFTPANYMAGVVGVDEFLAGTADSISGLVAVDDYTIRFDLKEADPTFLPFIFGYYGPYLVPAHIVGDVPAEQFDQHEYNMNPANRVGMGPFILSEVQPDQYIVFTRNDTYFKGAPLLDQIVYRVMQPDVALAGLLNGEIDLANIPASEFPTVQDDPKLKVLTYEVNLWNGLMFNMTKPELQDPRIHQAVLYALDRNTYAERILNGLGTPWDSIIVQSQWTSANVTRYEYNPDKAKELLAAANWDSERVVEWRYYNDFFRTLAPVLQQSLADVGFKINPVELETSTWVEAYQAGEFDFSVVGGGGITDDPSELVNYFQCDVWSRYCNQEVLDLFAEGRTIVDQAERKAVYDRIQEIVNADSPWFPLFSITAAVGTSPRLTPVAYSSYDYLFYEDWSVTE
jgi:peptide/nickel transport system substrate-binding protein